MGLAFANITQSKSLEDVTGLLSGVDRVDWEGYGMTTGHDSAFHYITYALFYMLLYAIGSNALNPLSTI